MKTKRPLLLIASLLLIALIINSCKKDKQTTIAALFTTGKWELASEQVTFLTGSSTDSTRIITLCDSAQYFKFNTDNTCTYNYFDCTVQPISTGKWSLAQNQLYLQADITCKDSTAASVQPFANAQIYNLGQFSLILKTGDIEPNYSLTKKRIITQYGFVRITNQ
jgi:hypothetical protein